MKKLSVLLLGGLFAATLALGAEPTPADQKWVQAVEKMVAKGEHKVSTPKEERVSLLKDWAAKNGYSVKVTKNATGYSVELTAKEGTKNLAQK
jgi:hypothetical protein